MKGSSRNRGLVYRELWWWEAASGLLWRSSLRREAEHILCQVGFHGCSPLSEPRMSVRCLFVLVSMRKQGGCGSIWSVPSLGTDFFYAIGNFVGVRYCIKKPCRAGLHCGGKVDVAEATRRRRRILPSRILFMPKILSGTFFKQIPGINPFI